MKTIRIIIVAMSLLISMGNVMAQENFIKAQQTPQVYEVVLSKMQTKNIYESPQEAFQPALKEAQERFPGKTVGIRNLTQGELDIKPNGDVAYYYTYTIVELPNETIQKIIEATNIVTEKAIEDSRFAIEDISIINNPTDVEVARSHIINLLLSKGYKVMAKEKLQKFYKALKDYKSGIYNTDSTPEIGNFTAALYYINYRITDEYVLVQLFNIEKGEYVASISLSL